MFRITFGRGSGSSLDEGGRKGVSGRGCGWGLGSHSKRERSMQHAETKPSERSHHAGAAHHGKGSHDARPDADAKAGPAAAAPVLEGAAQTMVRSADVARELLQDWQGLIQGSA